MGNAFVPLSPMATLRWALVARELDRLSPQDVLELGCGQGGYGARIAARVRRYVGVEPDPQSSAVARSRIAPQGGEVITGMSDDVPAAPSYDLVCAFEVIEHLEHDTDALRDWMRRLRPGGSVLVSVPAWPRRFGPMDAMVGHFRRYEPAQLESVLRAAGCENVRVHLYGWPLGFLLEAVRNRLAARRQSGPAAGSAAHEDSMAVRSAASGRTFQPKALVARVVRLAATPFSIAQLWQPHRGTGLVGVGRLPENGVDE